MHEFLPWYSSVHRGAGHKSQRSTAAYEAARAAALRFAGRPPGDDDVAIICRNTTEAINHLAYRLDLAADDVVVTTVVEHHANLLPWARLCQRRYVECGTDGTFTVDDVTAALDAGPRPRLLAVTAASNVTGWLPPIDDIIAAAHERDVPVLVDAAQLAAHRPLPADADFVAWSGHKMYAPFGAGVLIGPRAAFSHGDPFLAGGGAVDLVDLDEVAWTDPPDREEAGSPNVIGAVALHAAIDELGPHRLGRHHRPRHPPPPADARRPGRHTRRDRPRPRSHRPSPPRWSPSPSPACPTRSSPPDSAPSTPSASATAASAPIPTSSDCSASVPTRSRATGTPSDTATAAPCRARSEPAAGFSTSIDDVDRLVAAVADIASGRPAPVTYHQDPATGDFHLDDSARPPGADRALGASCARG